MAFLELIKNLFITTKILSLHKKLVLSSEITTLSSSLLLSPLMLKAKKALRFALLWAALLAIIKLIFWIISGSMVLIASAIDSLLDFIVSVFNLFALKEAEKPADKEHNYGHGKIEAIAALLEGILIGVSGWYIIFSSVQKLIFWVKIKSLELGMLAMVISLTITGVIVAILYQTAKTTKSLIVQSDLMHYKMDFLTNAGVILALILIKYTNLSFIDPVIAIGIAIYILRWCRWIIKNGFDLLMDKSLGKDKEIWTLILNHPAITSFHKLKTHKSGGKVFISFHMVFKNPDISLKEAHKISYEIEATLKKRFRRASVLIRLDPFEDL